MTQEWQEWKEVLQHLARRPYAGDLLVFGSAARGRAGARSDLDVFMTREPTEEEARDLLRLTMQRYPALDPFVLRGGVLHSRDRWGQAWEAVEDGADEFRARITRSCTPLLDLARAYPQ